MSDTTNGRHPTATPAGPDGLLRLATDLAHVRAVADLLPQLVWSCRPDGRCDYLSRRWVEYTGVPEAEHHGTGWLAAVHPDDLGATRAAWQAFVAGTGEYDVDYRLRRQDGVYRWFKTRGALVRDPDGVPVRVFGTTTDIDAQKRAEEGLRDSEERLRLAQQVTRIGTFDWNIAENTNHWSPEILALYGLTPEAFEGTYEAWLERLHPDDAAKADEEIRRSLQTGQYDKDFRVVWPDGSVRWIHSRARVLYDTTGRPVRMLGINADITDRKLAEERLGETEERAAFVRRASGVGFWYCDLPFDVLEWDELVKAHFHLPPDARVTIDTFYARIHPDDREPTRQAIERSIAERTGYDVHYRTVHPTTGEEKWVRAIGRTFYAPDGTPRRFDGVTLDVTEQKRAEDRSRAILESISDAFFALGKDWRFTYVNREAERLLGRTRDDLVGKSIWAEFAPALGTEFERCYRRAAEENVAVTFEAFYPPLDAWYEVHAYPSPAGLSVYFRDISERHRVSERERLAAEANAKFRAMVEQGSQFAGILALDGTVLEANRTCLEGCGFTRGDVIGKRFWECGWWDRSPALVEMIKAACRGAAEGRPFRAESAYFVADGTARVVDLVVAPVTDDSGRVLFVAPTGTDITDRKRAEVALRESEARYRTLFNSMDEGFCVVDVLFDGAGRPTDYRFVEVNPAFERHTGLAAAVGRTARELVPDLDAFWYETYGRVATTGEPARFESVASAMEGRWFEVHAFKLGGEASRKVAILFTDVSFRRRTEEALRDSERQFREMADTAPVALWLTDPDGSCTFLSREWYDFTGQTESEALGLGWTTATHPDDQEDAGRTFLAANAARTTFRTEYRLRTRDGTYRWAVDIGRARFAPDGGYLGMVGAVFDLEDRKQAEDALRDADRKKDDFIALLAHELRNPLAPIRNGLQVMRLAGGDADRVKRARDMMDRQLTHMVRLVDDLLDVSRITRNKMELRRERILLSDVVASAVETARPAVDAPGHTLAVSLPPDPLYLDGDLTRLAQVVSNLLTNSAKYTPSPGRIWLTAEAGAGEVVVRVRDTGIGIPAESLPRIFDMFSQVDRSIERSTGGLGIGLALVKGLVDAHGGSVAAESAGQGSGSTFTVRLPLAANRPAVAGRAADSDDSRTPPGPRRRVLVVDDNRDSAQSMAEMLALLGHDVRTAHDGAEAVEAAEAFRPELVLMDVGMPRLNGYDATRVIRGRSWGKAVTVVALTGWGQDGDRAESERAGCDGHLVKPIHVDALEPYLRAE